MKSPGRSSRIRPAQLGMLGVRFCPRQVRGDHLVAGLLEHGHLSLPHARVEREGVQEKEDAHSRGMSTASGISPARSYP